MDAATTTLNVPPIIVAILMLTQVMALTTAAYNGCAQKSEDTMKEKWKKYVCLLELVREKNS